MAFRSNDRPQYTSAAAIDAEHAAVRVHLQAARVARLIVKYSPDQPRVPAGQSGGGQWTDGGGGTGATPSAGAPSATRRTPFPTRMQQIRDVTGQQPWSQIVNGRDDAGRLLTQEISNRDGSTIFAEYDPSGADAFDSRYTVTNPDGSRITFSNSGNLQTVTDARTGTVISQTEMTPQGPEPVARVELARDIRQIAVEQSVRAMVTLYGALSTLGSGRSDAIPAMAFNSNEFVVNPATAKMSWVSKLTQQETQDFCPRYEKTQYLTDQANDTTVLRGGYSNAATFGTAVHSTLKGLIDKLGDPNFRAEETFMKALEELPVYGKTDSIRVDVLERVGNGTTCVYDIKTGLAGLTQPRIWEIASRVRRAFPDTRRIVVIEVRPRR